MRFPAVLLLVALAVLALVPAPAHGWPPGTFEDHVRMDVSPAAPTANDEVTVSLRTVNASLFIKGANLNLRVTYPDGTAIGPSSFPFAQESIYRFFFILPRYPNATIVSFYVTAWDFDNDVLTSTPYAYTVAGAPSLGWKHEAFEDNVEVLATPPIPQPHDEVTVSIRSREPNVEMRGANLYLKYIYQQDPPRSGGYPFVRANATWWSATISGFPPGTEVVYWVVAWDVKVDTITSSFYAYNLSVDRYTRHEMEPFPSVEAAVGLSLGLAVAVPVSVLYVASRRRRRRA